MSKYCLLARGDAHIYMRVPRPGDSRSECSWDHAMGALLVREAGGIVSDAKGRPLDFGAGRALSNNFGVLACSSAAVHARAVAAVAEVLEG